MKKIILVLVCIPCVVWPQDLQDAIVRADVAQVKQLLQQGADCNERFGDKKRTALMLSVDHLAGELLTMEQELAAKVTYVDLLGGVCVVIGVGMLGWWCMQPAQKPVVPVLTADSPVEDPLESDSDEPAPEQPKTVPVSAQPASADPLFAAAPEPIVLQPVSATDSPAAPTRHLHTSPPPARSTAVPLAGRPDLPPIVPPGAALHTPPPPSAAAARPPQKPPKPSFGDRIRDKFRRLTSCVPGSRPPAVQEQRPMPQQKFLAPVGATLAAVGVAAAASRRAEVRRMRKVVDCRVAIIRALLETGNIDCQARDSDGKTVIELFDAYTTCKLQQLKEIWQNVRELIAARQS